MNVKMQAICHKLNTCISRNLFCSNRAEFDILQQLSLPQKFKIRIEDPPQRKHMVFMGGAVLANIMKDKESFWLSRAEYEERGLKVLDKLGGALRWDALSLQTSEEFI